MTIRAVALMAILTMANPLSVSAQTLTPETAGRFARLALDCVHLEYPNKIAHVLTEDADARTPHQLTPAFFGCYDWHSSVHGHWLLVRLIRLFGNAEFVPEARGALARSLTTTHIAGEVAYQTSALAKNTILSLCYSEFSLRRQAIPTPLDPLGRMGAEPFGGAAQPFGKRDAAFPLQQPFGL